MKITSIKLYDTASETAAMKQKSACKLVGIDAIIEKIRKEEDVNEVMKHLEGWREEMGFAPSQGTNGFFYVDTKEDGSVYLRDDMNDIVAIIEKGDCGAKAKPEEKACRDVAKFIRDRYSKKEPVPVSRLMGNICQSAPQVMDDTDRLFETFFDLISGLRREGYFFYWDSKVLYNLHEMRLKKEVQV